MNVEPKNRIIVALDVSTLREACAIADQLAGHVGTFKVGLQLITREGAPQVVREISNFGTNIMFDGKFHDIPNTMAGAVDAVADMAGVWAFTLHASASQQGMEAAVRQKKNKLALAVTVLTSFDNSACHTIYGNNAAEIVPLFAEEATKAGVDGIICSPQELRLLDVCPHALKVVPGVRPTWAAANDQKRVMTPGEAIKAGADYLVIGRPITNPPTKIGGPVEAANLIAEEIGQVLVA